jgi:ribosomal protein S4
MRIHLIKLLKRLTPLRSVSDSRRMVVQGGIRLNGQVVEDPTQQVDVQPGDWLQVGTKWRRHLTENDIAGLE